MEIRNVAGPAFRKLSELIRSRAGIHLVETKRALLSARLAKRLRDLGGISFDEYYRRAADDEVELTTLLDLIATNETHFFREPVQWKLLTEKVLPDWERAADAGRRPRTIRAWSAGCSSGEEPFTLAMVLAQRFALDRGWHTEIDATDLSTRVLERARAATWPIQRAEEIPAAYLKEFFLRGIGPEDGKMRASPELRTQVRFTRVNLIDESQYPSGPFDLIFCRNVLIYFEAENKQRVVRRLIRRLAPGGLLLLGHAESLLGSNEGLVCVGPAVYRNRAADAESAAPRDGAAASA